MAEIIPFRALHYNPEKIARLKDVVTQPYDKITAEMQAHYYGLNPHNAVRIIRGHENPGDAPNDNVYTRATAYFHEWIENQVLISAPEPAIYPYYQEYNVPGQDEKRRVRQGFIALCKLEDYEARVVHRHEETLSGPKADRLELLKATRAHFGQIFMLYSDPTGNIEATLAEETGGKPWERVIDEYSTTHSVWRVTEPRIVEQVVKAMKPQKLVIADGHHRYETALAFRNYCRAQGEESAHAGYVMMTFIRVETEGLTILPTHRVLHSLPGFRWGRFIGDAQEFFDWQEVQLRGTPQERRKQFLQRIGLAGRARPTFGVFAGPETQGMHSKRRDISLSQLLPDLPASLSALDVVILHRILLEQVLGVTRQAVREEKNLRYVREYESAVGIVEKGEAQLCFLMNPTPIRAMWDNALAGHVLPQKSTDFYPKLLSGLTVYWLDNPAGS
ncbi:MAG: DUF1015 domain-containing protein [Terriglobia bacterium]